MQVQSFLRLFQAIEAMARQRKNQQVFLCRREKKRGCDRLFYVVQPSLLMQYVFATVYFASTVRTWGAETRTKT